MPVNTNIIQQSVRALGVSWRERAVRLALLAIIFTLPFSNSWLWQKPVFGYFTYYTVPKFYAIEVLIGLTFLAWLTLRRPIRAVLGLIWPIVGVVGLAFASVHWSVIPEVAMLAATHFFAALLLLTMFAAEFRQRGFAVLALGLFCIVVGLQAIWGGAQVLIGHDLGFQELGENILDPGFDQIARVPFGEETLLRAYGSLSHPTVLAAYLSTSVILLGTVIWWPKRRVSGRAWQAGLGLLLALMGTGLLLTFSRAAGAAVALSGLVLSAYAYRLWRRVPLAAWIAGAVMLVAAGLGAKELLVRVNTDDVSQVAVGHRAKAFGVAGDMIAQQPYGAAAGNYSPVVDQLRPDLTPYERQPVHNVFLLLVAELGIAAGILIIIFVLQLTVRYIRAWPRDSHERTLHLAVGLLLLVAAAMAQTDHFFVTTPHGLWLGAVILALGVSRVLPAPGRSRRKIVS